MKMSSTLLALLGVVVLMTIAEGKCSAANEEAAELRNMLMDTVEAGNGEEKRTLTGEADEGDTEDDDGNDNLQGMINKRDANSLSYNRPCDAKFKAIQSHSACVTKSRKFVKGGVSKRQARYIVKQHNRIRGLVDNPHDPKASDMLKLSWDRDLAKAAQAWAESCSKFPPVASGMIIPNKFRMGQNIATGERSWPDAINSWLHQRKMYSYGSLFNNAHEVSYYTAMVWAKTYKIGCGFARCSTRYKRVFVCNYGPEGNKLMEDISGQIAVPYTSSKKGCSGKCKKCRSGLCVCSSTKVCKARELSPKTCKCTTPLNMGQ